MKKHRHLQNALSLSLPLCLIGSFALTASPDTAAQAAHSEPAKTAKPLSASNKTQVKPPELTPATLLGLVRSAKILDPEYPVHVTLANQEAELATVRHPKATDQDCKIDAVLVAKAVMDVYPKEVIRIKLLLGASGNESMQEITVTTGDVKAFATGTISKEELLDSLEIKKADNVASEKENNNIDMQIEGGQSVAPGAYRNQRQLLQGRIEHLKARGTGTKPYEEMLAKIESDVQKPPSEVPRFTVQKEIGQLNVLLNEQEQALREAQHIADGTNGAFRKLYGQGNRYNSRLNNAFASRQGQGNSFADGQGNGQPGGLGNGQAGAQGSSPPPFPAITIKAKIRELNKLGRSTGEFQQAQEHIMLLRQQGNRDQANQEAKELLQKLDSALGSAGH